MSCSKDSDYVPLDEVMTHPRGKGLTKKKKSSRVPSFLDGHRDAILALISAGSRPSDVAKILTTKLRMKEGSITGKQISNWIGYKKKSKQIKTVPVSLNNNNLKANTNDSQCMISF